MSRIVFPHVRSALGRLAEQHAHYSRKVGDLRCPHCGQSYEIVPSRRELCEPFARRFFSFYHCRICENRFRVPRFWLRCTVNIAAATAVLVTALLTVCWLV